ncbi:glycoside hydrolase family 3 N-terminal domain-containing protein [Adhaeribacter aerolatus]|nr:glycoside hydrolase family 3 N-terminal domain-containing protein [Adhaeribacter aerolatus]
MLKSFNIFLLLILVLGVGLMTSSSPSDERIVSEAEHQWVDSVFATLTPDQRLGQLFMVTAYSNKDAAHVRQIERLITQYNIGGLMFMQGGPKRQVKLTNQYQSKAHVPLFIAMDAEWGLSMRLDSSMYFAKQMTLGAINEDKHVYLMGREIALKLKRMGVHVSFSPVLDVNSNPRNPVIGNRSFGESIEKVSSRGIAYIKGLQDHGIVAVAKHFPGHGDTDKDSHKTLPVVKSDMNRLQSVDLYPFKKSFDAGVMGVMVAHIHLPVFDTTANTAATLSHNLVTGLLKEKMNYKGLVFTDALNMRSVTKYHKPGEVDALALIAGNDILLYSEDVPVAMAKIKEAVAGGKISQEEVDYRVKKVLHAKYWAGLNNYKPVETKNLTEDLNRPVSKIIQQQLYENAVTVVTNKDNFLPFRTLDTISFASVAFGGRTDNTFTKTLQKYAPVTAYETPIRPSDDSAYARLYRSLQAHNVVVVSLHKINNTPVNSFGIPDATRNFIKKLQANPKQKVIVVAMGNPYSLQYFEHSNWLVCGYENNEVTQLVVPQVLFGALPAQGTLPVSASPILSLGRGFATHSLNRLRFTLPEAVGLDSRILTQIDNIAREAIAYAATPGCQVLVAKDGAVIFEKAYGHFTYDKTQPVTTNTIYDIASITKVASTLQAIMYLKDRGKLSLDAKVSQYLPDLKGTNKQNITMRELLAHQAGLQPGLPFHQRTTDPKVKHKYYADTQSLEFPHEVVPGMYAAKDIEETMWEWIKKSPMLSKPKGGTYEFKYSDLTFYFLRRVAERLLNQNLSDFMDQNFYGPMGLTTLGYTPLTRFTKEQIAPTENDTYFRKAQIWGTVHDQGAAMLGGIAGHAGLFSNAFDVAALMQMNLQGGTYGGHRYFNTDVVSEFAQRPFKGNRRGLGWDMAAPDGVGATSNLASLSTYGHTGFTGTCAWVDPETNLVYIFLSNRVNPDAVNNKLTSYSIRTRIHDVIYNAIIPKT